MAVYLIECRICGEQYTYSTKTKFRSLTNIYKSTHQKFISKKEVPNQTLKQKRFHEHYFTESHTSIDTLKELKPKSRKVMKSYSGLFLIQLPLIRTSP